MTVGILTFHMVDNYGAVLQCYALQTFLSTTFGLDVEVIDFSPKAEKDYYKVFSRKSDNIIVNLYLQFLSLIRYKQLSQKRDAFQSFRNNYLKISLEHYETPDDVIDNLKKYDRYIVGSDQVFNPYGKYCQAYVDFDKKNGQKIAYAPSFGISDFNDLISERLTNGLKTFDYLSCRETQGAEYLTKITGHEVPTMIDPVFLLSKEQWEAIAITPQESDNYILVYNLNGGNKLLNIAYKIYEKTKYKVICITGNTRLKCRGRLLYDVGPLELLGYISRAKYVVTDSFHGTALSAVLLKNFYTYIALPKTSSRIVSLLKTIGLQDRIVQETDSFEYLVDLSPEFVFNIKQKKNEAKTFLGLSLK